MQLKMLSLPETKHINCPTRQTRIAPYWSNFLIEQVHERQTKGIQRMHFPLGQDED